MSLLQALTFFSFWACGLGLKAVEQSQISISVELNKRVDIDCKVSADDFESERIHWYSQKQKQALEHLVLVASTGSPSVGKDRRVSARKSSASRSSSLTITSVKKEDEATYYCAGWVCSASFKIFGEGTKLIVISPGERSSNVVSPKPTIFFPSVREIKLNKTGTYLCLLENFFPDVIKVYWKRAGDNTILGSQEGDTMKTDDTYMKFSWLTVTEDSMTKEHKCIVRHEANERVDQEILFGPIKQAVTIDSEPCFKHDTDMLRLQLTNTSAYYTYLLLLLKSALHGALVVFCLLRWFRVCCDRKSI